MSAALGIPVADNYRYIYSQFSVYHIMTQVIFSYYHTVGGTELVFREMREQLL